jgi:hypothetical protein
MLFKVGNHRATNFPTVRNDLYTERWDEAKYYREQIYLKSKHLQDLILFLLIRVSLECLCIVQTQITDLKSLLELQVKHRLR